MRTNRVGLCVVVVIGPSGVISNGQGRGGNQAGVADPKPPTDGGAYFTLVQLDAASAELAAKKLTSYALITGEGHDLEVRRLTDPQPIMIHSNNAEVVVVRGGEGTFATGGELVGAQKMAGGNNMRGS